jgi:hypothetical protein
MKKKKIIKILTKNLEYGNPTSIQDSVEFKNWVFRYHVLRAVKEILKKSKKKK